MTWRANTFASALAALLTSQASAQRKDGQYWPCNPTTNTTGSCTPNYGLDQYSYSIDLTNPPSNLDDYWSTSDYANITYNTIAKNGAELTFWQAGNAPQLYSNFYILFGHVDVVMQVAPGTGMITSSVLLSDDFDEIDWEMSGNNFNMAQYYSNGVIPDAYKNGTVQNNYFGKGITGSYDRGQWEGCTNPQTQFHTYSVDWTPARIEWLIDGVVVRTLLAANADKTTHQFPQTPSRVQIGIWDGGAATEDYGTYVWAGGRTDVSKAPFTAYLKSISIKNYYPAKFYNWTDQSGTWTSIKQLNISSLPASYSTRATSAASSSTSILPLRTDLPLSTTGHCGPNNGTICKDSGFGDCCSVYGYCGSTTEYCGTGCLTAYGLCGSQNAAGSASHDGSSTLSVVSSSSSGSATSSSTNILTSSTVAKTISTTGSTKSSSSSSFSAVGASSSMPSSSTAATKSSSSTARTSSTMATSSSSKVSSSTSKSANSATTAASSSTIVSAADWEIEPSDSSWATTLVGPTSYSFPAVSTSNRASTFSQASISSPASSSTVHSAWSSGTTPSSSVQTITTMTISSSPKAASSAASSAAPAASSAVSSKSASLSSILSSEAAGLVAASSLSSNSLASSSAKFTYSPISGSSTQSAPSSSTAVPVSGVTGAVCMKYDGTTIEYSNGEQYSIICNTKNTGSVITTINSIPNIPACLPYCDKSSTCVAIVYHENVDQCSLLSFLGSSTYDDFSNLAVRNFASSSTSSAMATASPTMSAKVSTSAAAQTTNHADPLAFLISILEHWLELRGH